MEGKAASDSPAKATPSLGTYQLVVVDHDQLHILGLTVHCRVPPTDLGVGGHLESVPTKPGIMTKPWTDSGGGGLYSSQGQCQLPWDGVGVPCSLCMRAGSLSLPTKGMCIDNSVRERGGGASSVWALLCPPHRWGCPPAQDPSLRSLQPEVCVGPRTCLFLLSLGRLGGAEWAGAANRQPGGRVQVRGARPAPSLTPPSLPYLVPCIRGELGGEGSGK